MNVVLAYMNIDIATISLMFLLGFYCLIKTRNMVRMIIGTEIMARAASYSFIYFGYLHGSTCLSQSIVVTIIVVEVVVSAIALAIIMNLYKINKSLDVRNLTKLKG